MFQSVPSTIAIVAFIVACVSCSPGPSQPARTVESAVPEAVTAALVVGRAPGGAIVTLEPADGAVAPASGGALMDQYAKAFVPATLFVRVGQEVTFRNSEDQLHNVTVVASRTGTAVFNISQSPFDTYRHTFERAGEFDVSCDVHPGMQATIVATTTPYAVYADANGTFTMQDVAPGSYKLRISADGRQSERAVEVRAARVDLGM